MGEKYDHAKHLTGAQQQQMSHQAELKTKGLIHTVLHISPPSTGTHI